MRISHTWAAAPKDKIVKSDVSVAKNYLSEQEIRSLERIVLAQLDLAENRAERRVPMTMEARPLVRSKNSRCSVWIGRTDKVEEMVVPRKI